MENGSGVWQDVWEDWPQLELVEQPCPVHVARAPQVLENSLPLLPTEAHALDQSAMMGAAGFGNDALYSFGNALDEFMLADQLTLLPQNQPSWPGSETSDMPFPTSCEVYGSEGSDWMDSEPGVQCTKDTSYVSDQSVPVTQPKTRSTTSESASPVEQEHSVSRSRFDRGHHQVIERRYRENLNDKWAELKSIVPTVRAKMQNKAGLQKVEDLDGLKVAPNIKKGTIIAKAAEYIQHLEERNAALSEQLAQVDRVLQIARPF